MNEAQSVRDGMSADEIISAARALVADERNLVANCANVASLLWYGVPRLNWAGFYLLEGSQLVLGPFQGRPACTRIALGRGVCGTAAAERRTILVPDVRLFPGHISCDGNSRAELVVPLLSGGRLIGVLDLDSPEPNRFGPADRALAESAAEIVARGSAV